MFDFKTIATAALTAIVVVVVAGLVGGNQSGTLGASGTRFPNGISADTTSPTAGQVRGTTLTITGAQTLGTPGATTSIDVGKVCYTVITASGTPFYLYYNGTGALATSSTSCL